MFSSRETLLPKLKNSTERTSLAWARIILPTRVIYLVPFIFIVTADIRAEEITEETAAADSVDQVIEERDAISYDPTQKSLFPDFHYIIRDKLHEWERKIGLEVSLGYDALVQGYLDNSQDILGTAGDLTLSGKWLLLGTKYTEPLYLTFRIRNRHSYNNEPPSNFRSETGLLWGTVDGFNDSGVQIPSFYFNQNLRRLNLTLNYGQFSIDHFFDSHSMRSAKRYFLNQAFSANPTINFPSYGAGAVAQWEPIEQLNFVLGASNIQGTDQDQDVDLDLTSSALFKSIQGSYLFQGLGGKTARIQIMGWDSDANSEDDFPAGNGISFTLEHDGPSKGEKFLLRYAHADGDSTLTETILMYAYGKEVKKFNHFGIGFGTGKSSNTSDWQSVFEMYYKIQIAKELILTPDLQIIFGNSVDDDNDLRYVAGLRLGLTF